MKVYGYRTNTTTQQQELVEVFDIHEATYSGKDMGERKIDADIKYQTPIDFQIGDYIELQMADLRDSNFYEKFYIKTLPTVKKTSSSGSVGDAFEHSVTFYPSQFDLTTIQMRDLVQETNAQNMLYTGYDEFSFMAGAHTLMRRIMYVLNKRYGNDGVTKGLIGGQTNETAAQQSGEWEYMIAEAVDEDINTGLEKFQLDFSQNTVWDALTKLTDEAGINTTFFINNKVIYVGFTRPHIKQITSGDILDTSIFNFEYGKSSHLKGVPNSTYKEKGGLYDITKSIGQESPITRLYAYGAQKNLSRFYCADRLTSGRYIPQLMLPSFMNDGVTDYIESAKGIQKFGVREGSKRWDDIYPTLQHVDYKTLRDVKYVFKIEGSGLDGNTGDMTSKTATIRCYQVVPSNTTGVNKLQAAWPPVPVAIFVHATGKTVKCVMYTNASDQKTNDHNIVPTTSGGAQIDGACFCVHKLEFSNYSKTGIGYNDNNVNVDPQDTQHHKCENRSVWFTNMDDDTQISGLTDYQKKEIELHQIQYTDDYWGNDVFEMGIDSNNQFMYDAQTVFMRNNMSFGCWPRIESNYQFGQNGDNVLLNEVVYVQPVTTEDTDENIKLENPSHFYIYLRDYGFKINEQAYSGQYNWLIDGAFHVSFLDGYMGGLEFEVKDSDPMNIVCAYNDDGTENSEWLDTNADTELDANIATLAKNAGAIWRLKCIRNTSNEYSILPNKALNPAAGDHIAFLNIRMPDVYILAAQNRLLTKAQKYLNDNDNGSISYAISMDKVRMAQQPKLGLQMREGTIMRIKDADLDIYTDNEEQTIYKSIGGAMGRFTESPQTSGDFYGKWNNFVQIRGGKHYVIEAELTQHHKLYITESGQQASNPSLVRLFTGLTANTSIGVENVNVISVIQNYSDTHKSNVTKNDLVKVEFDAQDNLGDESNFVLAFQFAYTSASTQEYVNVLSIVESNTATQGESAKYVDLTIDQLTIKLSDTVREYNPNSARRAGNGGSSTGQTNKDISATVRERQKASAWGTLVDNIEEVSIESAQNSQTIEHNADVARKNFSQFEKLRNAIFDPDGTVNEVFFRTMMLQVGVDSMNYALDNTYIANGKKQNISLMKDNGIWKLNIGYDTLRHYAVISGNQGGTWKINKSSEFQLDYDKIYYIALKCSANGTTGDWIVETEQPTVDKYTGYKVFNYGIVMSCESSDSTRFISETRGNVYVYGDNVVLGRIATQDGSSYLDMIRGKFKLGNGLMYENGELTIQGNALSNLNVGGENLSTIDRSYSETKSFSTRRTYEYSIPVGKLLSGGSYYTFASGSYVLSAKSIFIVTKLLNTIAPSTLTVVLSKSSTYSASDTILSFSSGTNIEKQFTLDAATSLYLIFRATPAVLQPMNFNSMIVSMSDFMVQKGYHATEYHPYSEDAVDMATSFYREAISGSTSIAGGLVMTNILALKNESGNVTAGMSGLTGTSQTPEDILLWGGGSYANALLGNLPVILKKAGVGSKIGCFRVESNGTSVSVIGQNGDKIIIEANDNGYPSISMYDNNVLRTKFTTNTISPDDILSAEFSSGTITSGPVLAKEFATQQLFDIPGYSPFVLDSRYDYYTISFNMTKVSMSFYWKDAQHTSYLPQSFKLTAILALKNITTGNTYYIFNDGQVNCPVFNTSLGNTFETTDIGIGASRVPSGTYKFAIQLSGTFYSEQNYGGSTTQLADQPFITFNGIGYEGDVSFVSVYNGTQQTIIGSNGFSVQNNYGYAQILNDGQNQMYVSMHGLPLNPTLSDLKNGQLYRDSNGNIKIKIGS